MRYGDRGPLAPYHGARPHPYYSGFGVLDQLRQEMDGVFNRMQSLWNDETASDKTQTLADRSGNDLHRGLAQWRHSPSVDFDADDDAYHISVELPGVKSVDINVDVSNGVLRIEGEKRSKREEQSDGQSVRERHYGRFSRSLRLPDDIDDDAIEATFENGVLEVTIPKSESSSDAKRIEIRDHASNTEVAGDSF